LKIFSGVSANNCFNLTIAVVTRSAGRLRSPALLAPSLRLWLRPQLQVKQMLGGRASRAKPFFYIEN